mgnify:CR=1 FL=1
MDNINLQRIEGYTVQLVAEDVWAIDEFGADIIYLVKGEKSAAVIDTGSGFGNLKKVIETLTDLPYVVLNTHGHLDHVGGNHEFGKAYLSEKDFKMADTEKLRSGWKHYVEKTKKEPGFYGTEYIIEGREPGDFQMLPLSEHQIFDLGGISKSPAIFDIDKLTHFNALYLRSMAPEEFAKVAEPYIRQTVKNPDLNVAEIAGLLQARCEKLTDIPEKVDFFDALPDYDVNLFANKKSKSTLDSSKEMLSAAIGMLANLPSWSEAMIHDSLVGLAEGLGVKNALLMWPVRIAAAGKAVTPGGAVEICHILGRDETVRRLKIGLEKLSQ